MESFGLLSEVVLLDGVLLDGVLLAEDVVELDDDDDEESEESMRLAEGTSSNCGRVSACGRASAIDDRAAKVSMKFVVVAAISARSGSPTIACKFFTHFALAVANTATPP